MTGFLLLLAAAVLLTGGAELFAENAAAAGRRLGVTALAIGLILAGAEPEELVTAIFAAAGGHPGIAAGDAIGANITMLTLVLGLAAVARPIAFGGRLRSYAIVAGAAGIAAVIAVAPGRVGRLAGIILVALYACAVALIWRAERRPPAFGEMAEVLEDQDEDERDGEHGDGDDDDGAARSRRHDLRALLLVIGGLAGMVAGGRLAVAGATRITAALGLGDSAVGLTLVALATTAELFALVWASYRRGVADLAMAGVLGSAIYNSTVTLGVAALVRPLAVPGFTAAAALAAVLPLLIAGWALAFRGLGRVAGLLLIACYAGYLALIFSG